VRVEGGRRRWNLAFDAGSGGGRRRWRRGVGLGGLRAAAVVVVWRAGREGEVEVGNVSESGSGIVDVSALRCMVRVK